MRSELTLELILRCPDRKADDGVSVDGDLTSLLSSPQLIPLVPLSSLCTPVFSNKLSALTVHFRANSIARPVQLPYDEADGSSLL
jgi:hypothetical protein